MGRYLWLNTPVTRVLLAAVACALLLQPAAGAQQTPRSDEGAAARALNGDTVAQGRRPTIKPGRTGLRLAPTIKRTGQLKPTFSPDQLPLVLQRVDMSRLLPTDRIVTPSGIPNNIGLLTQENPSRLQRPAGDALHVADTTGVKSDMSWNGQNLRVTNAIIAEIDLQAVMMPVLMSIDQVERVARGVYHINFTYRIFRPNDVTLPLRFHLNLVGDARQHVGWIPWVHQSGTSGVYTGRVVALMQGTDTPLRAPSTAVGINAADSTPTACGNTSINYTQYWWKRYEDITRDDIKDYIERPQGARDSIRIEPAPAPTVAATPSSTSRKPARTLRITRPGLVRKTLPRRVLNATSQLNLKAVLNESLLQLQFLETPLIHLQGAYRDEPALLFIKTSDANFAKVLIQAERDSAAQPWHLFIKSAHMYGRNGMAYTGTPGVGGGAGVANEEYATDWEGGGYIFWAGSGAWSFNVNSFDFDWLGVNALTDERDIVLLDVGGQPLIDCVNGAKLTY